MSKGLTFNLWKTRSAAASQMMACGVCSLRVKASSVLCVQCGKWIHSSGSVVKRVTAKF